MLDGQIGGITDVIMDIAKSLPKHLDKTGALSLEGMLGFLDDERSDIKYELVIRAVKIEE